MNFLDKEGLKIFWANILDKINASKTTIDTTLTQEGQAADAKTVGDALSNIDVQDEIYIGDGELPEGYTLQINPDGNAVALASVPYPVTEDIGKFLRVSDIGTYALNEITMAEEVNF